MISFDFNKSLAEEYGDKKSGDYVKKAFEFSELNEAIDGFEIGKSIETECSVVFSDISDFSETVKGHEPNTIKEFLDIYYKEIIPLIHSEGGLIDQMQGDGIISVYSKDLSPGVDGNGFYNALRACESIVKAFSGNEFLSTKCVVHSDKAIVCHVGNQNYHQATIVGNIMTVVHRLEAVALRETISMLADLPMAQEEIDSADSFTGFTQSVKWELSQRTKTLAGVGKKTILDEKYVG